MANEKDKNKSYVTGVPEGLPEQVGGGGLPNDLMNLIALASISPFGKTARGTTILKEYIKKYLPGGLTRNLPAIVKTAKKLDKEGTKAVIKDPTKGPSSPPMGRPPQSPPMGRRPEGPIFPRPPLPQIPRKGTRKDPIFPRYPLPKYPPMREGIPTRIPGKGPTFAEGIGLGTAGSYLLHELNKERDDDYGKYLLEGLKLPINRILPDAYYRQLENRRYDSSDRLENTESFQRQLRNLFRKQLKGKKDYSGDTPLTPEDEEFYQ